MTLRVITVAGTLELGEKPPAGGPACYRCKGRAQVELDAAPPVRSRTGWGQRLTVVGEARRLALCVPCLEGVVGRALDRSGNIT